MNQPEKYYQVGGTLKPDDPSYIERQADKNLYEGLRNGNFCYVFNSRQMGKSSLQVRVSKKLENEDFKCVVISLERFGTKGVTQDQWYDTLIKNIADNFDLQKEQLSTLFKDNRRLTPLNRLSDFIENILLSQIDKNIVVFIDEIDTVLSLDFPTDDFFGFIRYCYNQRANNPNYERITFALLGVATPSQLIKDTQRTPFNIGVAIQLNGFSFPEARLLTEGLESKVNDLKIAENIIREILKWTGGQPFLTQKICQIILYDENVIPSDEKLISKWIEELVKTLIIDNWEFQDEPQHLRTIRNRIINSKEPIVKLLKFYRKILQHHELSITNTPEQSELVLSGLLEEKSGKLKVYNLIYESIFDSNWVAEMLAEMRPYEDELLGWLSSNRQDKSWLLQGKKLQKAMKWCADKNLTIEDYQFINASQELKLRKVERFQRWLTFITVSMVIIAGISTFQLKEKIQSLFLPYILEPELFSQGEKTFFLGDANYYQTQGVEAFKQGNYSEAIELFQKAKNVDRSDPEAEIYYNNALAHKQENDTKIKPLTIGVVVPIYARKEVSKATLRGVAQAQANFNKNGNGGLKGRLLNIVIADDSNNPNLARKVAQELIKDSNVLAVIGHNASEAAKYALSEYQKADLAMLSNASSSNLLRSQVFFRTTTSNKVNAELLSKYAIKNKIKRVVIYYKPEDAYSDDVTRNFETFFQQQGGKVELVDLRNPKQNASDQFKLSLVSKNPPDAVVFFPTTELISTVIDIVRAQGDLPSVAKKVRLLGGTTLYNSESFKQGKEYVQGLILSLPWFPEEPNSKAFAEQACNRWEDQISWSTASSYDATQAFIAAVSKSDNPSRKDVINNLKSIQLPANQTSGDELKFTDGERTNLKPVLVRVVKGSGKKCGGLEGGGFHFEKVPEDQSLSN
ncbi:TPR repeat-containing protein [Calothrix sp. NIES-2100]|uniref:ABC transporter substrate-binding protein n=1 Tax=Calothrix sp. NIES-2100 TaxID=1954172 RepID=UPI000B5FA282|nr:TPR repeat-containing protein [Calothrix sp. NIES-2100]